LHLRFYMGDIKPKTFYSISTYLLSNIDPQVNNVKEIKWRMTKTHADLKRFARKNCESGARED
jgi:hypothetical protein